VLAIGAHLDIEFAVGGTLPKHRCCDDTLYVLRISAPLAVPEH
jgi:hypothetical protein